MSSSRSTDGSIELIRLTEVATSDLMSLMNDERVHRHLPLMKGSFDEAACSRFVASKERMWETHGYGPWAIIRCGELLGWGGLQPEGEDADLGLILKPAAWGSGRRLVEHFLTFAFSAMSLESVIALLPQTRRRRTALSRLGFEPDGEIVIGEERFVRYRLWRTAWTSRTIP